MVNDLRDRVCDTITIRDVLAHYGYDEGRRGRTKCPIHIGQNDNFSYDEKRFICYKCGATGTVIDLVMCLYGLDFKEALTKLAGDFGIYDVPVPGHMAAQIAEKKAEREAKNRAWEQYLNDWEARILDKIHERRMWWMIDGRDDLSTDAQEYVAMRWRELDDEIDKLEVCFERIKESRDKHVWA